MTSSKEGLVTMSDSAQNTDTASSRCVENDAINKAGGERTLEVEHGPNWLFVHLTGEDVGASDGPSLAEQLTLLLEEHFTTRVVLEFDEIDVPDNQLIPQLERLDQWVGAHDGVIRLCGLPNNCVRAIARRGLGDRLQTCHNREEAVFGSYRPGRPR